MQTSELCEIDPGQGPCHPYVCFEYGDKSIDCLINYSKEGGLVERLYYILAVTKLCRGGGRRVLCSCFFFDLFRLVSGENVCACRLPLTGSSKT